MYQIIFGYIHIIVPKVLSDYYNFLAPAPRTIRVGGILLLPNNHNGIISSLK